MLVSLKPCVLRSHLIAYVTQLFFLELHNGFILVSFSDYQRQIRQKAELLKKKILHLNREESNTELSKCFDSTETQTICFLGFVVFTRALILHPLYFPLAKEILNLQIEVEDLRRLRINAKSQTDSQLKGE